MKLVSHFCVSFHNPKCSQYPSHCLNPGYSYGYNCGQAQFIRAEKNVKELRLSVDLMKKESRKLLERASLAEKDMKRGHFDLM